MSLCFSSAARASSFSTASAAGSSSKNAISAQLSKTFVAMSVQIEVRRLTPALSPFEAEREGIESEFPFYFAVLHHRLHHALAFERTAQAANEFCGDGFDENTFRRGF